MEFFASCPTGFEPSLADELRALGCSRIRPLTGRVSFEGLPPDAVRVCTSSRLASRVLYVIDRFTCISAEDLYEGAYDIPWESILAPGASVAMSAHGSSRGLRNTNFIALTVKDALCDRLVDETGRRPRVDAKHPDAHIMITLRSERATIAFDLAGEPLFHRGSEAGGGARTLRPDYASLLLEKAGWAKACREDGAGGGALVIAGDETGGVALEAARMLDGRAPNAGRARWGFEGWAKSSPSLVEGARKRSGTAHAIGNGKAGAIIVACPDDGRRARLRSALAGEGLESRVAFMDEDARAIAGAVGGSRAFIGIVTAGASIHRLPALLSLASQLRTALGGGVGLAALSNDDSIERALRCPPAETTRLRLGNEDAGIMVFPPAASNAAPSVIDLGDGETVPVLVPESDQFANRLRKVARQRRKWARRTGVTCYRVYDADLPDYSAAIDLYTGSDGAPGRWLVIAEYAAPKTIDPGLAQARMLDILAIAPRILNVPPEHVHARARTRSRGGSQYGKRTGGDARHGGTSSKAGAGRDLRGLPRINEGGLTFAVNFDDYLDTGIFLDHRVTRSIVRERAAGIGSFLNLFAYTGTATCYAAAGGARRTCTVDLSNTYLGWARENMRLNGFTGPEHTFERADVLSWIRREKEGGRRWDLIFCDPPTFSNSSKMGERTFDVQRDHVELLTGVAGLLSPSGEAIFSCNLRSFRPDIEALSRRGIAVRDITAATIPEDFSRNRRIHHAYVVTRAG